MYCKVSYYAIGLKDLSKTGYYTTFEAKMILLRSTYLKICVKIFKKSGKWAPFFKKTAQGGSRHLCKKDS